MIFRTVEQKTDLKGSFYRPDRPFFAAGACHVLVQAFLDLAPTNAWKASLILPHPGFRGMHVFASNKHYAFDYHGFTDVNRFREHYFQKMKRWFPGWSADILELGVSPISEEFCTRYNHRRPEQFYENPMPRANAYVRKFKFPDSAE